MGPYPLLPIARHARELLEHASYHLAANAEKDLIFALIHADNSVEIMLREHLRFNKNQSWEKIENKNFHELLDACTELETVQNNRSQFVAFHDIRNALYHTGTFAPRLQDVESAVYFSKSLFNELHPKQSFKDMKAAKPTGLTIKRLAKEFGKKKPYAREAEVTKTLSFLLEKQGYKTISQPMLAGTSIMADLLATGDDEVIVIEVKGGVGPVASSSVFQLAGFVEAAKKSFPDKKVKGWLVTDSSFSSASRTAATKLNIELITTKNLDNLPNIMLKNHIVNSILTITQQDARRIATNFVKANCKNAFDVNIIGVRKEDVEWIVTGDYSTRIEGFPWAFNFEVRIGKEGKVTSYNFDKLDR